VVVVTVQAAGKGVDMTIHQIQLPTPFPVGPVNAYLIQSGDQVVLVDCGPKWAQARHALLEWLSNHGLQPGQLTGVVLTHGHIDHVGLASLFQREGVPIYAHPEVQTWLEPNGEWDRYRADFFHALYHVMGMPEERVKEAVRTLFLLNQWNDRSVVDVPLNIHDDFPLIPSFKVIAVPGHAQAAVALWDEQRGVFIGGDQLLPTISSNALIEPELTAATGQSAKRTSSLVQYRGNLEYLTTLSIRKVFPGHGNPFDNPNQLIWDRLKEQRERQEQFRNLLAEKSSATAYELAVAYFPRHLDQLSLIMSETIGYLDWLHLEGQVSYDTDEGGVIRWRCHS
jgi:glyoxylase-like metal-dependent hydrolase (beta-lactamase superfamily II)